MAWLDCTRSTASATKDSALEHGERGNMLTVVGATRFFLTEAKVALSAGEAFGSAGAGHVRLNFATSTEVLTAAIMAMANAERAAAERVADAS